MTIRIVLADDHAAFRGCLKALLEQQPDLSVVMEADGGHSAIDAIRILATDPPDVLVLDMDMHDLSGLQAAQHILKLQPKLRILMLSWHDDLPFVSAAGAAGSRGYMLKDDPLAELVDAIRALAAGRTYLSAALRRAQISGPAISAFC
jgi:DNA-binding NarL/FixJ family response regulator